jgi:hypothetical protein
MKPKGEYRREITLESLLHCGPVAQLGARFHGMEEVVGSNPTRSTNIFLIYAVQSVAPDGFLLDVRTSRKSLQNPKRVKSGYCSGLSAPNYLPRLHSSNPARQPT